MVCFPRPRSIIAGLLFAVALVTVGVPSLDLWTAFSAPEQAMAALDQQAADEGAPVTAVRNGATRRHAVAVPVGSFSVGLVIATAIGLAALTGPWHVAARRGPDAPPDPLLSATRGRRAPPHFL